MRKKIIMIIDNNKKCSKCKKLLDISKFGKCKTASDGLQYYCKECSIKIKHPNKKKCSKCNIYYDLNDINFYICRATNDGYFDMCKKCCKVHDNYRKSKTQTEYYNLCDIVRQKTLK
jgi:hypothetical protein